MNLLSDSDFETYLKSYTQMRIGNKTIGCPYWSNKLENSRVTIRGFLNGKGEAEDIKKQLETVSANELKKGLITESTGYLLKLAKRERIGIDCSGLVYRLLSKLFYKEPVESYFPGGINKTNADTLTGKSHCEQIEKAENLKQGDLIRMMGGKHLLLVLSNGNNEITYIHSSGKSEITGVHTGKIIIRSKTLDWLEKAKSGENFGEKYFHMEEGDGFFRPFSKKPSTDFIRDLKSKNIHVVGVTGSEGSSILRFLIKNGIRSVTAHDYISEKELEKSYKLWHKGMDNIEREKGFRQFKEDLNQVVFCCSGNYLHNLDRAEIIFAPQSWRLYKQNKPLMNATDRGTPIYSMTRLYLELSKAVTIGVTGTVGKGSTANIIYQVLKKSGRNVYFAGNETWKNQILENITSFKPTDYLVLEISHRQLLDGVSKAPHITVVTNIYPNHQDEVSWEEYVNLKLLLPTLQKENDYAVLNSNIIKLRKSVTQIKSKVIFYNKDELQMDKNSAQYQDNIKAARAVLILLGLKITDIDNAMKGIKPLPARMELLGKINGTNIYDDIKSTTPWAVTAALSKTAQPAVLICGGETKGIDYQTSIQEWSERTKIIIVLKSNLCKIIKAYLSKDRYMETDNLEEALKIAVKEAGKETDIIVSPGAAYFYSNFIKGKKSLRKIVISLLQEGLKSGD